MDQHQLTLLIVVIAAVAAIVIIGVILLQKRRREKLRQQFGPEYDRVVRKEGQIRRAEGVLELRAKRRQSFEIRPLDAARHRQFSDRWRNVQSQFVDDPKGAVSQADQLVNELLESRGYPIGNFDQQAADISVDHPVVVENYRVAHDIALRHNRGQASTEDLRKAMVHYRSLFDELLEPSLPQRKEA